MGNAERATQRGWVRVDLIAAAERVGGPTHTTDVLVDVPVEGA